jgi:hypothetical protein
MIQKRLVEHLKQQHWTAAVIELFIVVLGVFIGLQVDNWKDAREVRQKSIIFTRRLEHDMSLEAWGVQFLAAYNTEVLRNADRALRDLSGEAPMTDEQFVISAYRATQFVFQNRYRATYDELVSTGNLGLVLDQELRQTATLVYTTPIFARMADAGRDSEYRRVFRMTVAHDVQDDLLERCGDGVIEDLEPDLVGLIDYPCTLGVSGEKIRAAAKMLRDDKGVAATLRLRSSDIQTSLRDLLSNNPQISRGLMKFSPKNP